MSAHRSTAATATIQGAPAAALGKHTAHGAFWTILFSMLNKVVAFGSQIALAWFLLPSDFGLVGMAFSVTSMAALISGMNLKAVLIQRQDRFDQDVGQVFWLSLAMGLAGTMLLALAAPVAGIMFKDHRVVPLILVVAASNFFGSIPTVYAAVLSRELQFRTIAIIQFIIGLANNLGAVGLAASHFGPYSLVIPAVGSSIIAIVAHRVAVGHIQICYPRPREWPELITPAGLIMLNSLLSALLSYGANFVIGLLHDSTVAGYYFWGFSIASQAVFLLATNLQGIFFPALTKLNLDPTRQYAAFRKACVILLLVTVPLCALQILLAEPVIKFIFHPQWLPAVGVVQGLSIGLMTQPISILGSSLLLARGQYGILCRLTGLSAMMTIFATFIGGLVGTQYAVAVAVGIVSLLTNIIFGWQALGELGQGWRDLAGFVWKPIGLVIPMLIFGSYLNRLTMPMGIMPQLSIVGLFVAGLYYVSAYLFVPEIRLLLNSYKKT